MTTPNLLSLTTLNGLTTGAALTNTVTTSLLTTPANTLYKVNSVIVTNISASSANLTMDIYNGTTGYRIAYNLLVPVGSTVVVIDKNSYVYLPASYVIRGGSSANSTLEVNISYESMS